MSGHPESTQSMDFRDKFKQLRQRVGVEQKTIAKVIDIRRETYNRWERGKGDSLVNEKIILLAGFILTKLQTEPDREILIQAIKDEIPRPQVLQLRKSLRGNLSLINQLNNKLSHT
ncbi:MAG: helix-turn-helix domain-containing protein [Candidatus Daviesbacteria bacterium]|nr:helix-turn-helix domain-containing protein [Candidatus Daviesbacteria bacterium]